MPELVLTTRRWSKRQRRRAGVAVGCAVGVLAAGSFVTVLAPVVGRPSPPEASLPPAAPGAPAENVVLPVRMRVGTATPDAPRQAASGVQIVRPDALSGGTDQAAAETQPAVGSGQLGQTGQPGQPGQAGQTGEPGHSGQGGLSGILAPGERLLLGALGIVAPALVPVADAALETAGDSLDGVVIDVPIRSRSGRR